MEVPLVLSAIELRILIQQEEASVNVWRFKKFWLEMIVINNLKFHEWEYNSDS